MNNKPTEKEVLDVFSRVETTTDIVEASLIKQKLIEGGIYQWIVTKEERSIGSKSGRLMMVLQCVPLYEENNIKSTRSSFKAKMFCVLPHENPDREPVEDELEEKVKVATITRNLGKTMMVLFGEDNMPMWPHKEVGEEGYVYDNEPVVDYKEAKKTYNTKIFEVGQEWLDPTSKLSAVGCVFFGKVKYSDHFINIDNITDELSATARLNVGENFFE